MLAQWCYKHVLNCLNLQLDRSERSRQLKGVRVEPESRVEPAHLFEPPSQSLDIAAMPCNDSINHNNNKTPAPVRLVDSTFPCIM